ncbi:MULTISPECIES: SseB family protein [unclassified Streptomyces]|uniref:SseB family protein n=1 Tax=unclassified Streptomyces TaxID=2593676 RepID=UPI00332560AD
MTENGGGSEEPGQRSRLADLVDQQVNCPAGAPEQQKSDEDRIARGRHEFAVLLGEFRRTAVLVPFDDQDSLWTADQNGVRWICAFSNEESLARFAEAQGSAAREWTYRTILGARLLDVMVPMLGMPAGVALDAASDDGMLFPPVKGIVPDAVAVDLGGTQ